MCLFRLFKKQEKTDKINSKTKPETLKEKQTRECEEFIGQIEEAVDVANALFQTGDPYIQLERVENWKERFGYIENKSIKEYAKAKNHAKLLSRINLYKEIVRTLDYKVNEYNESIARGLVEKAYEIVGNVEGRPLDRQQMMSIVKGFTNQLIIAGAGTGKTTTILGKVKYVLKTGQYNPEDILILSFTNAASTEMENRLQKEIGENIQVSTFHKLGLNIIKNVEGKVPKITTIKTRKFINQKLMELAANDDYLALLCKYALYGKGNAKTEFEFTNEAEYKEYLKINPPTTINEEIVKSYGEMDIANFLFQNQIKYIYEPSYIIDTNDAEFGQYHPDFYLPDFNIYIEYFGIDKEGNVPDYFKGRGNKTASQTYNEGIEWKRKLHKEQGTILVECYAFEKFENVLVDNLKIKLEKYGVTMKPKTNLELWNSINNSKKGLLEGIVELFETVINLIKSNNFTYEEFTHRVLNSKHLENLVIVDLIKPIYEDYCNYLVTNNEIDFNDMINKATEYVCNQQYTSPYSFVIVDEYQDISKARYKLLYELRKSKSFRLFCVGDDWQSIYRFAGSDINYILDFDKYWGLTDVSKIETTYRFINSLIEISGWFITKNPRQIKKYIKGKSLDNSFALGVIEGYTNRNAISFMLDTINELPSNSSIYLIGRYSFDVEILKEFDELNCKYNNETGFIDVVFNKRKDLNIKYMTAHRSKGLQADYVFILNNNNSKLGFPSKIQDSSILDVLLEGTDIYPYAEERRLFYVALTRAKKKVYLITLKDRNSIFAEELKRDYKKELNQEKYICPQCGGNLVKRNGPYGEFFGCSNYSRGCKYMRKMNEPKKIGF